MRAAVQSKNESMAHQDSVLLPAAVTTNSQLHSLKTMKTMSLTTRTDVPEKPSKEISWMSAANKPSIFIISFQKKSFTFSTK